MSGSQQARDVLRQSLLPFAQQMATRKIAELSELLDKMESELRVKIERRRRFDCYSHLRQLSDKLLFASMTQETVCRNSKAVEPQNFASAADRTESSKPSATAEQDKLERINEISEAVRLLRHWLESENPDVLYFQEQLLAVIVAAKALLSAE